MWHKVDKNKAINKVEDKGSGNQPFFKKVQAANHGLLFRMKRFDMFGEQIKLTYRGDYKYRTKLGAILTIIFLLSIGAYGLIILVQFYSIYVQ
jgi:hypothetical protein